MARLAIDIGGTFTDLVHFDEASGELSVAKTLTTPADLTEGVVETIRLSQIEPADVSYFIHGGTTVVNAITERKGAKTALVNTVGFRDVLELARANRPDMFNIRYQRPKPFVRRRYRFEVRGRLDADGQEVEPLHLDDLEPIAERCRHEDIEAIAIMLVNSYANPAHEEACAARIRKLLPGVAVTSSHEITREWREYERASTAVLNAYVQPIVQRYLERLETTIEQMGVRRPFMAMQSNGGTTTFGWAKEHPIAMLESGPAAGVNGAALAGALCGAEDVIYLDVGGTTAKCSAIEGGKVNVTTEYAHEARQRESGYPIRVPVVDIVEIGAGGGSIAWFDEAGSLHVGPLSAGAAPGPACYRRGGAEPTVTDAKLIAGALNPSYFAAGSFQLGIEEARRAMRKIADGLKCSIDEAAAAVIRLVEANMIEALKLVSVERGLDPREFTLVVGGGGGAMHAGALGRELGVREIIIPRYPGLFSAWGMLATEPRRDFALTDLQAAAAFTLADITARITKLRRDAENYFGNAGIDAKSLRHRVRVDLRYTGQEHAVGVTVSDLEQTSVTSILEDFHNAHERSYGYKLPDSPVEFVTFRLVATAEVARPELTPLSAQGRSYDAARKGKRVVHFGESGEAEAEVLERDLLPPGFEAEGPLVVEEPSSVTLVHPDQDIRVDRIGFLRVFETAGTR